MIQTHDILPPGPTVDAPPPPWSPRRVNLGRIFANAATAVLLPALAACSVQIAGGGGGGEASAVPGEGGRPGDIPPPPVPPPVLPPGQWQIAAGGDNTCVV